LFFWWKIDLCYASDRAYRGAFPAQTAFSRINGCQVVGYGYGFKRTGFQAQLTTDASNGADLADKRPFVLIGASHKDPAVFWSFWPYFQNVARAGFYTGTT